MQSGLRCSMCTSTTSLFCTTCNAITYCSKTCEKADWALHKLICKVPSPSTQSIYYNGILFREKDQAPEFVTFGGSYQSSRYDDDEEGEGYYDYSSYSRYSEYHPARQLLRFVQPAGTLTITGNALRLRSRSNHSIEIYYNDKTPSDGSRLNYSILAATSGRTMQSWHGPLLAVKVETPVSQAPNERPRPPLYLDMDLLDLRDVVDLLSTFPAVDINDMTSTCSAASPKQEIPAVRINSPGDQALGRPKFEMLKVRSDDPACLAPVTSISRLIDLPIRVIRVAPPFPPEYDDPAHDTSNPAATNLHIGVDPAKGWGFVGLDWVDPPGSVIVVREGGETLPVQHLEALCHWCQFVLKPLFENSLGMGKHQGPPVEKAEVLARVTRREFVDFYVGFNEWKGGVDPTWKKAQWPFC